MAKHFLLFHSKKNFENSIAVRIIERYTGKKLTGYNLNLGFYLGTGIISTIFLSIIDAVFFVFDSNSPELSLTLKRFSFVFFLLSSFFLVTSLLAVVKDKWKDHLLSKGDKNEYAISIMLNIMYSVIAVPVFWFFLSVYPSQSKNFSIDVGSVQSQDLFSKCKDCDQKNSIQENHLLTSNRIFLSESDKFKSENKLSDLNSLDLEAENLKKLNELVDRITNVNINEITNAFGNISLTNEEKPTSWEEFLIELDSVHTENSFEASIYKSRMIFTALTNQAPVSVILEILNRGHQLDGIHTGVIATYLSLEEIKELENYGVDFSSENQKAGSNSNALTNSLFNKYGPEVYEYLLTKDSLVFSQDFDVVTEVLRISSELNRPIHYTQKLIDRGAVMTEKTKYWIENDLRNNNPKYYSLVSSKLVYN